MLWFLGSMVILIGIALLMTLTGLMILDLLHTLGPGRSAWMVRSEPLAFAAFIGTAFWVLLCGPLSYLGFTFNQIRFAILPAAILLGALLWKKWPRVRAHKSDIQRLGTTFGFGLLPGVISLLPLALKNTFNLVGDPVTYLAIGDFLQTHDFRTPIRLDISYPYLSLVATYQFHGLRMGADFFLALVASLALNLRSIDVYPAVLAWGIVLIAFGLFLFMRWSLRTPRNVALLALFFLAVTPNTIQIGALYGFFPQTFGIAAFFFAMAVLTRIIRRSRFSPRLGILLGFSWAFLLSVYSELFPVLGIATLIPLLFAFWRSRLKKQTLVFVKTLSVSLLAWVFLSNYELFRFTQALPFQLKTSVGWYVPPDFLALWSAAMSAKPVEANWAWQSVISSIILTALFFLGLWRVVKTRQSVPLSILGTFLLMTAYFGAGNTGNSSLSMWPIYKITQWATVLAVALAFSALPWSYLHKTKILAAGMLLLCVLGPAPLGSLLNRQAQAMRDYAGSTTPVQDYFEFAQLIRSYNRPIAYQVYHHEFLPAILPVYFLMDHRLQGRWDGTYITSSSWASALPRASDTLFYCHDCPFPNARNPLLPAKYGVVQQPVISDIYLPSYVSADHTVAFSAVAGQQACLTVFSIQAGPGNMVLKGNLKKAAPGTTALKVSNDRGWQAALNIQENHAVTLQIPLLVGENRLCLESGSSLKVTISDLYFSP